MHLYLNYAQQHWVNAGENPPVGVILCTQKDTAVVHYALENLPNKVLAAEYRTTLPDEKTLAAELESKRSEEHTSELQSLTNLVCRLLLEKKKKKKQKQQKIKNKQ